MIGLQTGIVKLCAYSRQWEIRFAAEHRRLARYLGATRRRIAHIGSTAIPGLDAKPIIDIAVMIPSFRQLAVWIRRFEKAGYTYKGEYGLPGRHFFTRGSPVTHHLHLVAKGSLHWDNWILFRDYLRAHPAEAQRYREFKRQLAKRFVHDRDAYTRAKTPFVVRILAKARRALNPTVRSTDHG
jgi:GrpB-like predicted nucleotidyltransferase (UPF0157 family)